MITRCVQCKHHKVVNDACPNDWFDDDDEALVCTKTPNPNTDLKSKYKADHNQFRIVSGSNRPYETAKVKRPDWCPL
jgi:hypothetical protein